MKRFFDKKTTLSLVIIFVVLAILELVFYNFTIIQSKIGGLEKSKLDFSNCDFTGDVSLFDNDSILVRGEGTVLFKDVNLKTRFFVMKTNSLRKITNFTTFISDENLSSTMTKTGTHQFYPEGESIFYLTSRDVMHDLRFNFENDCTAMIISGITLNQPRAFGFNFFRFFICLFTVSFLALAIIKKLYKIPFDSKRISHKLLVLFSFFCCVTCILLSSVRRMGFDEYPLQKPPSQYNCYTQQFDAFMKGQINLDIPLDVEAFEALENPYDPTLRQEMGCDFPEIWDRAYYDGKLYSYFGVAPVLLAYYPVYWISGYIPQEGVTSLFFAIAATIAVISALLSAIRHYKLHPPLWLMFFAILSLCSGSMIYMLHVHASMYYIAMISGITFLALTISFSYKAADRTGGIKRRLLLILAAIFAVFTVISRPNMIVFAIMLAPLYLKLFFSKQYTTKRKLADIASFGIPLLLGAAGIMAYNYVRFDSPMAFGNNYQLTMSDISYYSIDFYKFFPAVYHYFLQPFSFSGTFPFIDISYSNLAIYRGYTYIYPSVGAICFPATLGVFGTPFLNQDKSKKFSYYFIIIAAVFMAFADLCLAGIHIRYLSDIMFPLLLVATLVIFELVEKAQTLDERYARNAYFAAVIIFSLTFLLSFALLFHNESNNIYWRAPQIQMFFANLFK